VGGVHRGRARRVSLFAYCELYRAWDGRLSPTMRQAHVAGEKLFVDYAGTTIDIVDGATGEVHACQLFVAALGASSLTYAEATFTQTQPDWIGSHTRAFGFYGGAPATVVPNLKSSITKACFYEPGVNRAYADMAVHYDMAIVAGTAEEPRDKAKVEQAVLMVGAGCSGGCAITGSPLLRPLVQLHRFGYLQIKCFTRLGDFQEGSLIVVEPKFADLLLRGRQNARDFTRSRQLIFREGEFFF
jgi:hypothetical protein